MKRNPVRRWGWSKWKKTKKKGTPMGFAKSIGLRLKVGKSQQNPYTSGMNIFHVNVVRHRMDDVEAVFRKYHIQIVDSKALRHDAKTLWRYTIRTKFSGTAIMNMIKRKDRTIQVSVE